MSQSERLIVLAAIGDPHLAHQLITKFKAKFTRLPIKLEITDDGLRALSDFQQKKPSLVIVGENLPGLDGRQLISEIRKIDGSTSLLFLKSSDTVAPEGIESLNIPVVDWNEALGKLLALIPDEWKAKYGLFERNSALFRKLADYGKKFSEESKENDHTPLVSIPRFFDDIGGTSHREESKSREKQRVQFAYRNLSDASQKKILYFEFGLLVALTVATGAVRVLRAGAGDGWLSLQSLLTLLTGISYLGFFLGRAFDRFVFSRPETTAQTEEKA